MKNFCVGCLPELSFSFSKYATLSWRIRDEAIILKPSGSAHATDARAEPLGFKMIASSLILQDEVAYFENEKLNSGKQPTQKFFIKSRIWTHFIEFSRE